MIVDLDQVSSHKAYHLLVQTLLPRPIAWVLSEQANGKLNLAPFSFFNAVSSEPPLVMLSVGHKQDGAEKDTRRNIRERGGFVIHIPHTALAEVLTASAAEWSDEVSEVEQLGLETTPFDGFHLPRLSACRVAYACEHYETTLIGPQRQAVIFGRVRQVYLEDSVAELSEGTGRLTVDATKVDALGRLGGNQYIAGGDVLTVARPNS